ncbi:MAG: DUF2142 domain-containing protein [Streptosporangiaceae bacterium]|jgi:hypothetical protein
MSPSRIWALAFLAFFLVGAAWAMASPYDGAPDEVRHIIRAAGVVQGQIFPTPATSRAGTLDLYWADRYELFLAAHHDLHLAAGHRPTARRHVKGAGGRGRAARSLPPLSHAARRAAARRGRALLAEARDQLPPAPATGAYQTVPKGLVAGGPPSTEYNYCYHWIASQSAACAPVPGKGGSKPFTVFTGAGRYNPVYYAAVGEPLVRWPDWTGILLARLISAALCAAFLASAWLSCVQWRRSRLLIAGLLVAATPAFFELAGAINPNSLEIAAGISLGAAAIPLLLDTGSEHVQGWLRRAAVAAIGIGQFRAMGPAWMAVLLAVLLIPPVRARLRQLWSRRSARWWSAAVVASCALGAAWTIVFRTLQAESDHFTYGVLWTLRHEITGALPRNIEQMVDGFSYLDTRPPREIAAVWLIALCALVIAAFAWGSRTQRWRLAALICGTLAIPVTVEMLTANAVGFTFQGRYLLPLAASTPLLAAFITGSSGRVSIRLQARWIRALVVILLPVQLLSLAWVMDRWQSGVGPGHSLDPLSGSWHPVTGSLLPLLVITAGLAGLAVLGWRAARPAEQERALPGGSPPGEGLPLIRRIAQPDHGQRTRSA